MNNSCFDKDTIKEISYTSIVEEYLDEYENVCKDVFYDIRMISEGNEKMLYLNIKNKIIGGIAFCCSPHKFMEELGDLIFLDSNRREKKLSIKNLFENVLLLYNEDDNIYRLYTTLNRILEDFEFIFDYDYGNTYIIDKTNATYLKFNGTVIILKSILKYLDDNVYNDYLDNYSHFKSMSKDTLRGLKNWIPISTYVNEDIIKYRKEFKNTQAALYF